jgi:hypothetical protein
VTTLQAELGLSGTAGTQKLRGRVLAGFAPGAMRLEGVAPFGSPAFILAADGSTGTLLLPRDRRVLQQAAPEEILNALIGVRLGADDLRDVLSGCMKRGAAPVGGAAFGPEWMSIDMGNGSSIYLHRVAGRWRTVAGRYGGLELEYPGLTGDRPSQIVFRSADALLAVAVSQLTVNGDLPRDQLVAVTIPPGMSPITIEQLRESGPLGASK